MITEWHLLDFVSEGVDHQNKSKDFLYTPNPASPKLHRTNLERTFQPNDRHVTCRSVKLEGGINNINILSTLY